MPAVTKKTTNITILGKTDQTMGQESKKKTAS
jgi:hypothetical protein